jgi:hypothetical protein
VSRTVVGYTNGHPIYRDDGPARGRVAGYGTGGSHAVTAIGFAAATAADVKPVAELSKRPEPKAKEPA